MTWPIALALLSSIGGCRLLLGSDERHFEDATGGSSSTSKSTSVFTSAGSTGSTDATSSSTGPSVCVDVQSDDLNCGVCSHVCAVGHCVQGDCKAIQITPSQPGNFTQPPEYHRLVVDSQAGGYVYYTRYRLPGQLFRAEKTESAVVEHLLDCPGDSAFYDLQSNDDTLFFSDFRDTPPVSTEGFYALNKDGSNLRLLGGSGLVGPTSIVIQDSTLFVATGYDTMGIGTLPIGGGAITPWVTYPGMSPIYQLIGGGIAVGGPWIYYSEIDAGIKREYNHTTTTVIYPSETTAWVFTVGPGPYLYWVNQNDHLRRGSVDGVVPIQDVAKVGGFRSWFVRGTTIYFSDDSHLRRVRTEVDPPVVETVIEADDTIGSIAQDATSFYWMIFSDGRIYRKSF